VRVDLRDASNIAARMRSHRALTGSVVLSVLVVAAAGIAGTTHFAGARWLPHWNFSEHTQGHRTQPSAFPTFPPRTSLPKSTGSFHLGTSVLWIVVAVAVVSIAALIWRWWARRPSRPASSWHSAAVAATSEVVAEPEQEPDMPALRTGISLALQVLDEQRDPADAIVRAWLGLQETAEESGILRRPAETPTEFTSRILSHAFADDRAIRTLLRLYLRTRFGDHPVTTEDVATVRSALEELLRSWPAPASPARVGRR
jgi:Domain of unknown function (DUF4129)